MSWYTNASSFIDTVGVSTYGNSHAVVVIGSKSYLYSGTDGLAINNKISQFKKMKNKQEAGRLCSIYLQRLQPFLQKQEEEKQDNTLFPI